MLVGTVPVSELWDNLKSARKSKSHKESGIAPKYNDNDTVMIDLPSR